MGKNNFIVSLIAGLTISLTLFLTIIIKSGTPFEWNLLLVYIGVGVVVLVTVFYWENSKCF